MASISAVGSSGPSIVKGHWVSSALSSSICAALNILSFASIFWHVGRWIIARRHPRLHHLAHIKMICVTISRDPTRHVKRLSFMDLLLSCKYRLNFRYSREPSRPFTVTNQQDVF
jgi:hypothetical protein